MKICGPKCSLCGLIISAWGIIQLKFFLRKTYLTNLLIVLNFSLLWLGAVIFFNEVYIPEDFQILYSRVVRLNSYEVNIQNRIVLMGIFYHVRSVALAEDLPIQHEESDPDKLYAEVERGYTQNAYNCWIAACLYILTFILSGHQFYVNSRSSLTM